MEALSILVELHTQSAGTRFLCDAFPCKKEKYDPPENRRFPFAFSLAKHAKTSLFRLKVRTTKRICRRSVKPPYPLRAQEKPAAPRAAGLLLMVEVGGVGPPSESALTGTSPGADGYCGALNACFRRLRQAVTPQGRVASLCMVRSKLCARTDAANRRSTSGPQHSRSERAA